MFSQRYSASALLVALSLMTAPVNAQWKPHPAVYAGSSFIGHSEAQGIETSLPSPYAQLQQLLGHKLYGYLLQNDEFIVLQDLVVTHLEKQYAIYSSK